MTPRVVVLDDFFPNLATGFRVAEFGWMLRRGVVESVLTTQPLEPLLGPYRAHHPDLADQIQQYRPELLEGAHLAWIDFLNNAELFLDDLTEIGLPFVVTLYPGGGLNLGSTAADAKLNRVLSSPLLRAVVTTQPRVTAQVRELRPDLPIEEILGLVVSPLYFGPGAGMRTDYYGSGRSVLHVGFVAQKYRPDGADKGYGTFLDTVRELRNRGVPIRAHVVGGFGPGDVADDDLRDTVVFHGLLTTPALKELFFGLDLVISPNRPGVLAAHAFDGFPTGSVVEAGLCGVGMVATDALHQNTVFRHSRDMLIVEPNASGIAEQIVNLLNAPGGLPRMARSGLAVVRKQYGIDAQLWTRRRLIERLVMSESARAPSR